MILIGVKMYSISIYDSVTKYKESNTIRGRLEVVFGMVLESLFFLFLLLNIVLLYSNL